MITGERKNELAAQLHMKEHSIISGLSAKLGGGNEGFNPHEIVEAALGACTVITCQMYANKKGWDLKTTNVKVKIISEDETGAVFDRHVEFVGELTLEQKEKLLEIANKTPVYKLLTRPMKIQTSM